MLNNSITIVKQSKFFKNDLKNEYHFIRKFTAAFIVLKSATFIIQYTELTPAIAYIPRFVIFKNINVVIVLTILITIVTITGLFNLLVTLSNDDNVKLFILTMYGATDKMDNICICNISSDVLKGIHKEKNSKPHTIKPAIGTIIITPRSFNEKFTASTSSLILCFEYKTINCGVKLAEIVASKPSILFGTVFATERIPIASAPTVKLAISKSSPVSKILLILFNAFQIPALDNFITHFLSTILKL